MAHTTTAQVTDHQFTPWKPAPTRCNTCGKVAKRHATQPVTIEATIVVHECEHTGDLERAAEDMAGLGVRIVRWDDQYEDWYETGYMVVRYQGTGKELAAALAASPAGGTCRVATATVVA